MTDMIKFTGPAGLVEIGARKLKPGDILSTDKATGGAHVQVTQDVIDELAQRQDFEPVGNVKPRKGKE